MSVHGILRSLNFEKSKNLKMIYSYIDKKYLLVDETSISERALELMKPNIITDRTIYDVIAFTLSAKSISKFEKRHFFDLMLDLRNEYDIVIYVSPEGVDIENNGVRETNADYRTEIDEIIRELLKAHPPKKLIEIKGSTEERINTITSQLI